MCILFYKLPDFYFVLCTDKLIYATDSGGFLRSGQKYSVNKNFNLHDLLIVVPDEVTDQNKSFYVCSKDKGERYGVIIVIFLLLFAVFYILIVRKLISLSLLLHVL